MKRMWFVVAALLLCGVGISFRAGRLVGAAPVPASAAAADPFNSDEARRHQMNQPHHWRSYVMNPY